MANDFSPKYSHWSDDELLHLASARSSLTAEAASALDGELRRRNLAESDRLKYQQFVKQQERRQAKTHRPRTFGVFKPRLTWIDLLWALLAMALISFIYIELPRRYHMQPDWQEAAALVMLTSAIIAVDVRNEVRHKVAFWISLVVSSAIHLVVVNSLTRRVPNPTRGDAKGAALLGLLLFGAVYGFATIVLRTFHGKECTGATLTTGR